MLLHLDSDEAITAQRDCDMSFHIRGDPDLFRPSPATLDSFRQTNHIRFSYDRLKLTASLCKQKSLPCHSIPNSLATIFLPDIIPSSITKKKAGNRFPRMDMFTMTMPLIQQAIYHNVSLLLCMIFSTV